jgi:hypothetical protein
MKEKVDLELCRELKESCAIDPNDVVVCIVTNRSRLELWERQGTIHHREL